MDGMTHSTRTSDPAWTPGDLRDDPHATTDKARRVRSMFASIAGAYDLNNRVHSLGRDQAWRRATVRLAAVTPTDDVLDVACGTGDLTEAFRAASPRSVTGLDFTAEMLDVARRKSSQVGAARPVPTYIEGDAMALPFEDASFDVVSIAFGIRNVDRRRRVALRGVPPSAPTGRASARAGVQTSPRFALAIRSMNRLYTHRSSCPEPPP